VSHGELEIARFTENADILWAVSGADIFTEGIFLRETFIEVLDFDRKVYAFSYDTGSILVANTTAPTTYHIRSSVMNQGDIVRAKVTEVRDNTFYVDATEMHSKT
jgi:hypothetical protein